MKSDLQCDPGVLEKAMVMDAALADMMMTTQLGLVRDDDADEVSGTREDWCE